MSSQTDIHGIAALTICEALLLALYDRSILPELEIMELLKDAATTHENAVDDNRTELPHVAVAELINKIIIGGNSVRRT